jgi:hypothetical protein
VLLHPSLSPAAIDPTAIKELWHPQTFAKLETVRSYGTISKQVNGRRTTIIKLRITALE